LSHDLGVALPYWLDRPDEEAVEIALVAERAGIGAVWVGEMLTFDAFALATAIGLQTKRVRLKIGPVAVGVRSPVAIALGAASVATLTGRPVDIALGSSSPAIVTGWHGRPWANLPAQMREAIVALRSLLAGERLAFDGQNVRSTGFKLRRDQRQTSIIVAAFGDQVIRVGARYADEVVLNLVDPEHVRLAREKIDAEADEAARPSPRLAVWVPAALDPGEGAAAQLAEQLALYLRAPGYGEVLGDLGFEKLVESARAGASRSQLAKGIPIDLIAPVAALGSPSEIAARIDAYRDAGADHVALVPSTAEDPAGRKLFNAMTRWVAA
jgi:probable F420-dependent oxidoreductase